MISGLVAVVLACVAFAKPNAEKLRLFAVAHSHDDVGWLSTVDQYYVQEVRWILTTMTQALNSNSARKFTEVEIAYFRRFWQEQNSARQDLVRNLTSSGALEFNLGGWCMADEAAAFYEQVIAAQTEGMLFLEQEVGPQARPRVGWSVDPFGHSAATQSMWAQMGMSGGGLDRIDYADKDARKASKRLEFVWESSPSMASSPFGRMWVHIMPDMYCWAAGVNFDGYMWLNADEQLPTYGTTLESQAQQYVQDAKQRSSYYLHNYVLMPYGCDFAQQNGERSMGQMDILIDYINYNSDRFGVTVEYSTFADYVWAVNALNLTWPVETMEDIGDFFPYRSSAHAPWTGYYTSRPESKGQIRQVGAQLRTASQLAALATANPTSPISNATMLSQLTFVRHVVGETQHHDAVTGTEKQAVADDYGIQMWGATTAAHNLTERLSEWELHAPKNILTHNVQALGAVLQQSTTATLVVRNSLGWTRSSLIEIPVNRTDLCVTDASNNPISSQVSDIPAYSKYARNGTYVLYFLAENLPPVGSQVFHVSTSCHSSSKRFYATSSKVSAPVALENDYIQASFDESTGYLATLTDKRSGKSTNVKNSFLTYYSASQSEQASGAYVFRPAQDGRIGIGSDNNGNSPYVDKSYNFFYSHPTDSYAAIISPLGCCGFNDTFAASVHSPNTEAPGKLGISIGRVDTPSPSNDPWGQSLNLNFLALDLNASEPFGTGFTALRENVPPSNTLWSLVTFDLSSLNYPSTPRLLASSVARIYNSQDIFTTSIIGITSTKAVVNVTRLQTQFNRGPITNDSAAVILLAWDPTTSKPPVNAATGSFTLTIPSDAKGKPTYPFSIPIASSSIYPVGDPIIVASIVDITTSPSAPLAHTLGDFNGFNFTLNLASNEPNGALSPDRVIQVNWIAYQRTEYTLLPPPTISNTMVSGPLVTDLHQHHTSEANVSFRIVHSNALDVSNNLQLHFSVGPLSAGHEVVTRFDTDIASALNDTAGQIVVEDNGLEPVLRTYSRLRDEPVAQNYWPASQRAWIADLPSTQNDRQLTIVGTRAHGAGAYQNGSIEFMLHRHCLVDDGFGVGEVLQEHSQIFPSLHLFFSPISSAPLDHRRGGFLAEYPSDVMISTKPWTFSNSSSALQSPLPDQIHLLSIEPRSRNSGIASIDGNPLPARPNYITSNDPAPQKYRTSSSELILRLQHIYPIQEYNQSVSVNLTSIFKASTKIDATSAVEYSLSANQPLSELHRLQWKTDQDPQTQRPTMDSSGSVLLAPRDLRTWVV